MTLLRQILCWVATGHVPTEHHRYLDPETGKMRSGRRCKQCKRRVL